MNRLTLPLLVVCLGLAAFSTWSQLERSRLAEQVAELEQDSENQVTRVGAERKRFTDQVAKLEKETKELKAAAAPPDKSTAAAKPADAGKAMMEGMAKMMSDPKMRDMMKSQARMGVDMMYRDLFDLLNLQEPQRTQFEKLIMEKATAGMEAAFAMMGADKTPEERKAAAAAVKKLMEESEAKIKDLLGKEDYAKVQRYEGSQLERMQLKTFSGNLAAKDLNMDEATEAKLMDVMYQEREKFPFASNYVDQQNPDITRFTAENSSRFNDEYTKLNESIANRAAGILSAPQLEVFRESQNQQVNMIKMQMEMGARMFGADQK